jgi:hypothetical protein
MQGALDRKLGGKVRNIFEIFHLENGVIYDLLKLQLLCQVVGDQPCVNSSGTTAFKR